jgi:translocation and assembly module TamB
MSEHKILWRIAWIVPLAILALFVAATLILHSSAFQAYALRELTQSASQSTGTQIDVQGMNVKWYPFAVELTGVTAQTPGATPKPLLFRADHVQVSLQLRPLLRREVAVQDLLVDHPVLYVRTESNGRTNLPAWHQSQSSSSRFAVQIAHLVIHDGVLQYDDRQIPLSAELRGFRTQTIFDPATRAYRGTLAYDLGRLQTAGMRTFDHRAEMRFVADAKHGTIEQIDLSTRHSYFGARAELTDYANPTLTGDYQARIVADDVGWILKNTSLPSGNVSSQGKFTYRTAAGPSWTDRTGITGNLESSALTIPSGQARVSVQSFRASFRLDHGRLSIEDGRANVLGGCFTSDSDVIDLANNSGQVRFAIHGASVEQAIQVSSANTLPMPPIAAIADLNVDASWKKTPNNAVTHVRGTLRQAPTSAANAIAIAGSVSLDYDAARNTASFQPSTMRTGNTELTASGVVRQNSALNIRLSTRDLHELGTLISALGPAQAAQRISDYDLHGGAELTGDISGAISDPHFAGKMSFTNLEAAHTKWRTLSASIDVDSGFLSIKDGSLINASQGRLTFNGQTKLVHWTADLNAPLSLQAHLQELSAMDLQHLANIDYPVEGLLNGEVSVSGSQQHPAARGHLELTKAVVWKEPLNQFVLNLNGDKQTIHLNVGMRASAGTLNAQLDYEPSARRYQVSADTKQLDLAKVNILQRSIANLTGQLTADVSGIGTLDNPQLSASLQIPQLQLPGENFRQVDARLDIKNKHTDFRLRSAVEQTSLDAKGSVELTPGYPANITVDSGKVPIGALLVRFLPQAEQAATGETEVHATLQGPLKNPAQLQGHAEIPILQLHTKSISLTNAGPIHLNYRDGILELAGAELKGNGTDIRANGSLPLQGPGNMNVTADGTIDLGILQQWTNGGHSSGTVTVQMRVQGPKSKPAIDGRVQIANAAYNSDNLPLGIEALNGDISVAGNRVNISTLTGKAGGGTVVFTGTALYGPVPNFHLALRANSVRLRQNGVRAVGDADLSWSGTTQASLLAGRVTVDKLSFTQGSDLSEIVGQFSSDSTVTEPSSFENHVRLNVAVQSSQNLSLASSQLSIAGSTDLTAQGTLATPVILGRISLTGGEVFFLSKRFEIDSGTIAFSNPVRSDPVLNLHVKTTVEQYNITANISGPIDRLKTTYTSDPALPSADIINLLAFGQTTAEAASNASTPASVGAESAVASAAGGQIASQVQKLTGISQLSLNPLAGNQNPGSQVAIQQRVSGNILLTFSTDITSAQNQSIQVQYKVRRNVSVSVLRDENGGYGIDINLHKVF